MKRLIKVDSQCSQQKICQGKPLRSGKVFFISAQTFWQIFVDGHTVTVSTIDLSEALARNVRVIP